MKETIDTHSLDHVQPMQHLHVHSTVVKDKETSGHALGSLSLNSKNKVNNTSATSITQLELLLQQDQQQSYDSSISKQQQVEQRIKGQDSSSIDSYSDHGIAS
jgi:hypothetical protein